MPASEAATFAQRHDRCPLCGDACLAPSHALRAHGLSLQWERCGGCRFVFQNPPLLESALRRLYGETGYFEGGAYTDYISHDPGRIIQGRRRMALLERFSGVLSGRLLDIGSASGFFGVVARERGFDVTCIEPDDTLARHGRDAYGLDVRTSTFEECDFGGEQFDLITLWGTDSHFREPLPAFRRIAALVRPGGYLAMNYQDFDHPIRRIRPSIKVRWNVMFNLSDRSFEELMRRTGLTITKRLRAEWQRTTLGHVSYHLGLGRPPVIGRLPVLVPAISFRWALARKDV